MQLCDRRVFYAHRGEVLNTEELDDFINTLQKFGKTSTQIVFSTPVEHRGLPVHSGFDA